MSKFAENTSVSVARSKAEIEDTLLRYGAGQFMTGWDETGCAMVAFSMEGRQVRFILKLPDPKDREYTHNSRGARCVDVAQKAWEQACRQRWRALCLVIKAKLEAVSSGISMFEEEFLSNIVLPNGRLVGEEVRPRIANAYETGSMPPMLPDYSS